MTLRRRTYLAEEKKQYYVFGTVLVKPERVVIAFKAAGLKAWPVTKGDSEFRRGKNTVKVLGDSDDINRIATEMLMNQDMSFMEYKRKPQV